MFPEAGRLWSGQRPLERVFVGARLVVKRSNILVLSSIVAVAAGVLAGGFASRMFSSAPKPPAEMFAYRNGGPSSELARFWNVPAFEFQNQHGAVTTQAAFKGHVWIADFMYTTCTSACPILTSKLVRLQRQLTAKELRFVSFSVDPEHDTSEALLAYAATWNAPEARWSLLRTTAPTLTALARDMHVAVEAQSDVKDPILHSSLFFLVDTEGAVRGIYDSNDEEALARLQRDARRLLGTDSHSEPVRREQTGAELYAALNCAACHSNPALAPGLEGVLGRKVLLNNAAQVVADRAYLSESITAPGAKLVAGFLNLMPSYRQELSDAQLSQLVEHVAGLAAAAGGSASNTSSAQGAVPVQSQPAPNALAVDPVCHMDVRVTAATPRADHAGHAYYFCSEACRSQFAASPGQFAPKSK